MRAPEKLKCPKCAKLIMKKILLVTHGKCNNCGYHLVGSMNNFFAAKISTIDQIKEI